MDIREMRYIRTIAQTKKISEAARLLYISQPALSKSLSKVEKELDAKIFYRSKNQLFPTAEGQVVLKKIDEIFKLMIQMNDEVSTINNLKNSSVTLGFPSAVATMYFPDLLIEFQKQFPNIELKTVEAGGSSLDKLVAEGELDLAIVMRPVKFDSLNEIPLLKDHVAVGVSPTHPLAAYQEVTIKDLENVPIITFDHTFNMHKQVMDRFFDANVQPKIAFSGVSCQFLYELSAKSGTALILPRPVIDFYSSSTYTTITFQPDFTWELCLIFKKNTHLSSACKTLINYIQTAFLKIATVKH